MIKVVCGILILNDTVLIAKRKLDSNNNAGEWEFPGGKVEDNEDINTAIIREFREELDIDIYPYHQLRTLSNSDIEFTPFIVKLLGGKARLIVHDEVRFVGKDEFLSMNLTPFTKESGKILFDSYTIFLKKEIENT